MAKCPNCGQQTARTEDWACQWCGYPLTSRSFKKIDRSFRELQEERNPGRPPVSEEPAPAPKPEAREKPVTQPEPEAKAPPEPAPEPEVTPEPEPPQQAEATSEEPAETAVGPEAESAPEVKPEPAPEPETPGQPAEEPTPEPAPPPPEEKEPEAEVNLEPRPDSGMIEATVAQLNTAFGRDRTGTNTRLKEQTLLVSGVVEKVVLREHLDVRYLLLGSGSSRAQANVRCTFGSREGAGLRRLAAGETATVRGTYGGYERNIILNDCAVAG